MPYDDPTLKEFAGYFEAKEPGRRERAEAWATAIGLQKVDGLVTSENLRSVARRHIEGEISACEARDIVDRYYESKEGRELPEDVREADKVSARIIEVINDQSFFFDPCYLQGLRCLILGERHELKNRFLYIGLSVAQREKLTQGRDNKSEGDSKKRSERSGQKEAVRKRSNVFGCC